MIELRKINGASVFVNPDLIRLIEKTPDTVLTFVDGEKLMVRDFPDEIVEKIVRYRQRYAQPAVGSNTTVEAQGMKG